MNYKEVVDKLKTYSRLFYQERKKRGHLTTEEYLNERLEACIWSGDARQIPTHFQGIYGN